MTDIGPILISMFVAIITGGIIGLERSYHGHPAGFRTHTLVCLASSLLMLVTVYAEQWFAGGVVETVRIDPTRMAQGVMTGIGFLGAGVIVKEGLSVRGLTTAATIWITAAIGIVSGARLYHVAILGTIMTFVILSLFRWFEAKIPTLIYAHLLIKCARSSAMTEESLKEIIEKHGLTIANMSYSIVDGGASLEYGMTMRTRKSENFRLLANTLSAMESIIDYRMAPTCD
jgi:putative Mg2+ transporter-C (MgtC) family protein